MLIACAYSFTSSMPSWPLAGRVSRVSVPKSSRIGREIIVKCGLKNEKIVIIKLITRL